MAYCLAVGPCEKPCLHAFMPARACEVDFDSKKPTMASRASCSTQNRTRRLLTDSDSSFADISDTVHLIITPQNSV